MEAFMALGLPIVALASVLFGYISVRHTRIFFGILTLSLSQVLYSLALKFFWVTGGTDGLRVVRPTLLFGLFEFTGAGSFQRFIFAYYYYVLAIFAICVVLMWIIVHSPFGKALQAIRDNETRAAFLGLRIRRFRLLAFTLSGTFTGLAGILWAPLNGLATPDVLYWPFSGEIVFTALLGGFRNFTGPIVGGIVFTYLKTYAVASTPYWQLLLGQVLVALVIILPTGIVGALASPRATWRSLVNASPDTLLKSAGILLMMVAFNWWLIMYGRANDFSGVAECLVYTATQCMPSAAPKLMWIGLLALAAGVILQMRDWQARGGVPMKSGAPAE
jgi:branched-chain amino acid transport system permease protein